MPPDAREIPWQEPLGPALPMKPTQLEEWEEEKREEEEADMVNELDSAGLLEWDPTVLEVNILAARNLQAGGFPFFNRRVYQDKVSEHSARGDYEHCNKLRPCVQPEVQDRTGSQTRCPGINRLGQRSGLLCGSQ